MLDETVRAGRRSPRRPARSLLAVERRGIETLASAAGATNRDAPDQLAGRGVVVGVRPGHGVARFAACLSFFSPRFSFNDLAHFFDWCWRGDLSAIG
jgi:hypothetical protein